ncbi:hypothetical protein Q783_11060 [Carnobacterium inhibens subsp. gilichinskyi]|uniref:Uncharacterized protein n=1 Tax=Carnobacterium inhibens subsp. gilichinskyi TaxID=1266845 RepID=U5SCB9_9LACT|nr:hypothetical protein Q783_11060 [Carnobacterium inhibens subsp. gilichinskyi]
MQKYKRLLAFFSTQLVDNNIRPCYDSKGAFVRRFLSISRADWYIGLKTILNGWLQFCSTYFFAEKRTAWMCGLE